MWKDVHTIHPTPYTTHTTHHTPHQPTPTCSVGISGHRTFPSALPHCSISPGRSRCTGPPNKLPKPAAKNNSCPDRVGSRGGRRTSRYIKLVGCPSLKRRVMPCVCHGIIIVVSQLLVVLGMYGQHDGGLCIVVVYISWWGGIAGWWEVLWGGVLCRIVCCTRGSVVQGCAYYTYKNYQQTTPHHTANTCALLRDSDVGF